MINKNSRFWVGSGNLRSEKRKNSSKKSSPSINPKILLWPRRINPIFKKLNRQLISSKESKSKSRNICFIPKSSSKKKVSTTKTQNTTGKSLKSTKKPTPSSGESKTRTNSSSKSSNCPLRRNLSNQTTTKTARNFHHPSRRKKIHPPSQKKDTPTPNKKLFGSSPTTRSTRDITREGMRNSTTSKSIMTLMELTARTKTKIHSITKNNLNYRKQDPTSCIPSTNPEIAVKNKLI